MAPAPPPHTSPTWGGAHGASGVCVGPQRLAIAPTHTPVHAHPVAAMGQSWPAAPQSRSAQSHAPQAPPSTFPTAPKHVSHALGPHLAWQQRCTHGWHALGAPGTPVLHPQSCSFDWSYLAIGSLDWDGPRTQLWVWGRGESEYGVGTAITLDLGRVARSRPRITLLNTSAFGVTCRESDFQHFWRQFGRVRPRTALRALETVLAGEQFLEGGSQGRVGWGYEAATRCNMSWGSWLPSLGRGCMGWTCPEMGRQAAGCQVPVGACQGGCNGWKSRGG
jgi:hypothetical protein